jgi:hypothetical protein
LRLSGLYSLTRLSFEVKKIWRQFSVDIYPDFVTKDTRNEWGHFLVAIFFVIYSVRAGTREYE